MRLSTSPSASILPALIISLVSSPAQAEPNCDGAVVACTRSVVTSWARNAVEDIKGYEFIVAVEGRVDNFVLTVGPTLNDTPEVHVFQSGGYHARTGFSVETMASVRMALAQLLKERAAAHCPINGLDGTTFSLIHRSPSEACVSTWSPPPGSEGGDFGRLVEMLRDLTTPGMAKPAAEGAIRTRANALAKALGASVSLRHKKPARRAR